jgi:type II secretory pathway component PulF
MKYSVSVLDPENKKKVIVESADSEEFLVNSLIEKGYKIISVSKKSGSLLGGFKTGNKKGRKLFFTNVYNLVSSGITLEKAVSLMGRHSGDKDFYENIVTNMKEGKSFSDACIEAKFLSPSETALLKAGETSGEFLKVLSILADYSKKMRSLRSKLMSMLYYPAVLLGLVGIVFVFIIFFVMPKLLPVFSDLGVTMPFFIQSITTTAGRLSSNPLLFLVGFGGFVFAVYTLVRTYKERLSAYMMHIPLLQQIMRRYFLFLLLNPLTLMFKSGIYIKDIIASLEDAFAPYPPILELLGYMKEGSTTGATLGSSIAKSSLFTDSQKELILISEESSSFIKTIEYLTELNTEEYENSLKTLISIVEPLIILFIGVIVLGFVVTFILPIMSIEIGM